MIRQGLTILLPNLRRVTFVLMVTSGLTLLSVKRTDEPSVNCSMVTGFGADYRILVVGESWSSDGKLFPELPKVVIMNGVNDEIQHVGASTYVEYTKKLVEYFSDAGDVEVVSIPRVNERYYRPPNLFSLIKRTILRCFFDGCDYQINDLYRVALWRDHPELHVIEFDNFVDKFEGHEEYYVLDGVHLTNEYYHKYGAFIGGAISLGVDTNQRK